MELQQIAEWLSDNLGKFAKVDATLAQEAENLIDEIYEELDDDESEDEDWLQIAIEKHIPNYNEPTPQLTQEHLDYARKDNVKIIFKAIQKPTLL